MPGPRLRGKPRLCRGGCHVRPCFGIAGAVGAASAASSLMLGAEKKLAAEAAPTTGHTTAGGDGRRGKAAAARVETRSVVEHVVEPGQAILGRELLAFHLRQGG